MAGLSLILFNKLEIMKDDRLYLRTLVKDGNGEEVEQILLKHKKKQGNLTII